MGIPTQTNTNTDTEPTFGELVDRFDRQLGDLHDSLAGLQTALQEQAEALRTDVARQSFSR